MLEFKQLFMDMYPGDAEQLSKDVAYMRANMSGAIAIIPMDVDDFDSFLSSNDIIGWTCEGWKGWEIFFVPDIIDKESLLAFTLAHSLPTTAYLEKYPV